MANKEFADELEKRTIKFAFEVINLSVGLPKTSETIETDYQLEIVQEMTWNNTIKLKALRKESKRTVDTFHNNCE